MRENINSFFLVICFVLLTTLGLAGCSKVQYKENVQNYTSSILFDLDKKVASQSPSAEEFAEKVTLTFAEACQKAAFADQQILSTLSELQKSSIDVDDAETHRLPRLSARVEAELPLNEHYDDDFELTGGLYFKYDIWKAVAQPDEVALRRSLVEKNLAQLHLHLNRIVGEVSKHLATLSLLDYQILKKSEALENAQKGFDIVELYAKQNRVKPLELSIWKKEIYTIYGELNQTEQKKREEYDSFLSLLGVPPNQIITISGSEEMMAKILEVPDKLPTPSEIWAIHSEARLAEVQYIAAEVLVKLTEMERYPKFDASLGIGSIPLTGNDEQASSLFQLSMSLPLWDAGDQQRKIAKAQIDRDAVKDRMQLKVLSLWRKAKRAKLLYGGALEYEKNLNNISKDSSEFYQGREKLMEEKRLDRLEILRDRIDLTHSAILKKEAEIKIREAAANYRFAAGYDIIDNIIPSLQRDLLNYTNKMMQEMSDGEMKMNYE